MKTDNQTVTILKALADETRLSVVRKFAVADSALATCDLVRSCAEFNKLSQPTMSHHVGKLVDAGILTKQKDGVQKIYRLNRELLTDTGINPDHL